MPQEDLARPSGTGSHASTEPSGLAPAGVDPARETYRGWEIYRGRWPEPEWRAIGSNYDASWEGEEDGWVSNGQHADAPTREALIEEIDIWFEENE